MAKLGNVSCRSGGPFFHGRFSLDCSSAFLGGDGVIPDNVTAARSASTLPRMGFSHRKQKEPPTQPLSALPPIAHVVGEKEEVLTSGSGEARPCGGQNTEFSPGLSAY